MEAREGHSFPGTEGKKGFLKWDVFNYYHFIYNIKLFFNSPQIFLAICIIMHRKFGCTLLYYENSESVKVQILQTYIDIALVDDSVI